MINLIIFRFGATVGTVEAGFKNFNKVYIHGYEISVF